MDKLYYLKYVSGQAHDLLEGSLYRNDRDAYVDAWNQLNQRYGHPFVIQRAFRERLSQWPKIQAKDAVGLRKFSDFLNWEWLGHPERLQRESETGPETS